jgi:hypothetical protein
VSAFALPLCRVAALAACSSAGFFPLDSSLLQSCRACTPRDTLPGRMLLGNAPGDSPCIRKDYQSILAGPCGYSTDAPPPKNSDINNIARLLNSALPTPDNELHPLHNTLTGEPMPNFPGTPAEIASMDSAAVNEALRALGADTTGRLEARRTRLRRCVGLRPVPV